jgi:cobalt/nickel transport protein
MNGLARNLGLLVLAAGIVTFPLLMPTPPGDFAGADSKAQAAIDESGYKPWFTPVWAPPSAEIASLLFALQAALGAGLLGYYFGRRQGQAERRDRDAPS